MIKALTQNPFISYENFGIEDKPLEDLRTLITSLIETHAQEGSKFPLHLQEKWYEAMASIDSVLEAIDEEKKALLKLSREQQSHLTTLFENFLNADYALTAEVFAQARPPQPESFAGRERMRRSSSIEEFLSQRGSSRESSVMKL